MKKGTLAAGFFLLFFFSFYSSRVYAVFAFNNNCTEAYKSIISLRFDEGKKLLEAEKKENPGNCTPYYLENYIDFLTLFIGENEKDFEKLESNMDERLGRIEKEDPGSPFFLFTQAEIYLQWAFARIKFKEYITAAYEINKAYRLLEENTRRFPAFRANLKSLGLLHAAIGAVPDEYKWIASITGMQGTIGQGTKELYSLIQSCGNSEYSYLRDETIFILVFIQFNLQKNEEEAMKLLSYLTPGDQNLLMSFIRADIAIHAGKNDEAIAILDSRPEGAAYFPFPYLDFIRGTAKLNRMDKDANVPIERFLAGFKGKNYIKSAWQKLAWFQLVNGNEHGYADCIGRCKTEGNNFVDEDRQAQAEAESGIKPNIILLRSRLLTDGGYYNKAISQFAGSSMKDFPSLRDKLELPYRLARIYHKKKDFEKAIHYYEQTLKNGASQSYYFAASSALQLGIIYENKKDFPKAREYYMKCLTLKNHEYKNSLDQKAKAGVMRTEGN